MIFIIQHLLQNWVILEFVSKYRNITIHQGVTLAVVWLILAQLLGLQFSDLSKHARGQQLSELVYNLEVCYAGAESCLIAEIQPE